MDRFEYIGNLIWKDLDGKLIGAEKRDYENWLAESPHNADVASSFRDKKQFREMLSDFASIDSMADWKKLKKRCPDIGFWSLPWPLRILRFLLLKSLSLFSSKHRHILKLVVNRSENKN